MGNPLPIDIALLDFVVTEDAVFHYTKKATALNYILPTKRLKLSQRKDTNDPWEYKFRLLNVSGSLPTPEAEQMSRDVHPAIDRALRFDHRVASFCTNRRPMLLLEDGEEVEDQYALTEGWNKPRMWTQYGHNHQGACLVFSKKGIEAVVAATTLMPSCRSTDFIRYTQRNRMPYESFTINAPQLIQQDVTEYASTFTTVNRERIFFRKHIDYRDEAEFRIALYDPEGKYEFLDVTAALKGVIWGDRSTDRQLKSLHPQCYERDLGCGFVCWDRGTSHLLLCGKPGET